MNKLESKIESILLFKNEPVTFSELAKFIGEDQSTIRDAVGKLQEFYKDRGVVVVVLGEEVSLGTHRDMTELIETIQKEELSRELGRAGLETLAIILYKGPISRREIDYIRGVNSGFILRTLLVRGLIERSEGPSGDRSYSYKPTIKLIEHLGLTDIKELPEYNQAFEKIEEFMKAPAEKTDE